MSLRSERNVVQNPLVRYATETGWTYLSPDDALRLRRGETSPILWETFIEKAQSLNSGTVDHLKAEEIETLFDLKAQLKHVDTIFARVFGSKKVAQTTKEGR